LGGGVREDVPIAVELHGGGPGDQLTVPSVAAGLVGVSTVVAAILT
jgi:hypothetical protein